MRQLETLLGKGLTQTAEQWPDLRVAHGWVLRAAHLLGHPEECPEPGAQTLRADYDHLLDEIAGFQQAPSELLQCAAHQFLKVSHSYGEGLFHCYSVPELPRTNNALEQFFGSFRYHERRATGRKSAAPGTVVRGSVRLLASAQTRHRPVTAAQLRLQLRPERVQQWRDLRQQLEQRHQTRRQQRRFRRDPAAFLAAIEQQLLKPILPP